jgi:hypothetical protein
LELHQATNLQAAYVVIMKRLWKRIPFLWPGLHRKDIDHEKKQDSSPPAAAELDPTPKLQRALSAKQSLKSHRLSTLPRTPSACDVDKTELLVQQVSDTSEPNTPKSTERMMEGASTV